MDKLIVPAALLPITLFIVSIRDGGCINFISRPMNKVGKSGGQVNYTCKISDKTETTNVSWWFLNHDVQISSGKHILSDESQKYRINTVSFNSGDHECTLTISNVTADDRGLYECAVYSVGYNRLSSLLVSQISKLDVEDSVKPLPPSGSPSTRKYGNFTECCIEKGVSRNCLEACSPGFNQWTSSNRSLECQADLLRILDCGYGGHNHVPCCHTRNVSGFCLGICKRRVYDIRNQLLRCSSESEAFISCFQQGFYTLPSPPPYVSAESVSPSRLEVRWAEPFKWGLSTSALTYRVFYKLIQATEYRSTSTTTDLTVTLTGLVPGTRYAVYVIAMNSEGSSQPSYTVEAQTKELSNSYGVHEDFSISDCCREQRVQDRCQENLCKGVMFEVNSFTDLKLCYPDLNKVLQCYTGMQNHTQCCRRYSVPDHCLPLCTGQVRDISLNQLACLEHLDVLGSCIVEGQDVLPAHPRNVTLMSVTHNSALLSWAPPSVNSDTVRRYLVRYRRYSSAAGTDKTWGLYTYEQLQVTGLNATLGGLRPSTMYEVSVLSSGDHGVSLPSPVIVFLTYSDPRRNLETTTSTPLYFAKSPSEQLRACCISQGVIPQCMFFCDYGLEVDRVYSRDLVPCLRYLNQFLVCANDGRNHTSCCARRGVHETCLTHCAMQHSATITPSAICIVDVPSMLKCFQENALVLPSTPIELKVRNVTQYTIALSWKAPRRLSTRPVTSYYVQYQQSGEEPSGAEGGELGDRMEVNPWNGVSVNNTEFIMQNLKPNTVYRVQVSSVSPNGTSLPTPMYSIATLEVYMNRNISTNTDITECCFRRNVSAKCLPACSPKGVINLHTCVTDLPYVVQCAADGKDHTPCCKRLNIPDHCLHYCKGQIRDDAAFPSVLCIAFIEPIFTCFREGHAERLPDAPKDFRYTDLGPSHVTFIWSGPPGFNSSSLSYSVLVLNSATGAFNIYENEQSPYTIHGLEAGTRYVASVRAVSAQGAGPQSTTITFFTLADDSFEIGIAQSPPGLVQINQPVTLKCNTTASVVLSVYWVRDGRRVDGSSLSIDSAQPLHTGRYTCVVVGSGEYKDSRDVFLRIQYLPSFISINTHEISVADNNETAHLHCQFSGYPVSVEWFKDGQPVDLYRKHDSEMLLGGVGYDRKYSTSTYMEEDKGYVRVQLSVNLVDTLDFGQYACIGQNQYGSATGYVWLTAPGVTIPPPITDKPRSDIPDLTDCCSKANVSSQCLRACSFDIDIQLVHGLGLRCTPDLPKFIKCAADGRNHTGCCEEMGVPNICLPYCQGSAPLNTTLHCLAHFMDILQCLERGHTHLPSRPQNVSATLDNGKISVTWWPPGQGAALVGGYRVTYVHDDNISFTHTMKAGRDEATMLLEDLHAYTTYQVTVQAVNHHGSSQASDPPVRIKTFELPPDPPHNVAVSNVGSDWAEVTWSGSRGNSVLSYGVHYRAVTQLNNNSLLSSEMQKVTEDRGRTSMFITDLLPGTEYSVYVTTRSEHCTSEPSSVVSFATAYAGGGGKNVVFAIGLLLLLFIILALIAVLVMRRYRNASFKWSGLRRFRDAVSFESPGYTNLGEPQVHLPGDDDDDFHLPPDHASRSSLMQDHASRSTLTQDFRRSGFTPSKTRSSPSSVPMFDSDCGL